MFFRCGLFLLVMGDTSIILTLESYYFSFNFDPLKPVYDNGGKVKMKKFLSIVLPVLLVPLSEAFALVGFGLHTDYDMVSIAGGTDTPSALVSLERQGFDNAYGIGGYLYIDAIPVVDLEADFQLTANRYDFQFKNALAELEPTSFGWARGSAYLTIRKKLIGISIPVIGGAKLHAGGGLNWHSSTPLATVDMVRELLDGSLENDFDPQNLEDDLVQYLKDNKIDASGLHFQVGLQIKLLALDAFLNYRYTMAKDVYPGEDAFGTLNLNIGFGF